MSIETAAGPIKVKKLAELSAKDKNFSELAFTWVGEKFTLSKITNIRSIGLEQLFDVRLDDGQTIQVSASSYFVTRSGDRKRAPELSIKESLLPLYISNDPYNYPTYSIPGQGAKRKISRFMAEWKQGRELEKGTYVSHIDGNRSNYHPDNLKITINKAKAKRTVRNRLIMAIKTAQSLLDECAAASPSMGKIVGRKSKRNHKVISVIPGLLTEVYTMSGISGGSLSVSGVFLELPS
jgi:hypothetical protein